MLDRVSKWAGNLKKSLGGGSSSSNAKAEQQDNNNSASPNSSSNNNAVAASSSGASFSSPASSSSNLGGASSPPSSTGQLNNNSSFASSPPQHSHGQSGGGGGNSGNNSSSSTAPGGGGANSSNSNPSSPQQNNNLRHRQNLNSNPAASPSKLNQLEKVLSAPTVDVATLRNVCWCGVADPSKRYEAWCIMLRYLPSQVAQSGASVLQRKRAEYAMFVQNHHSAVPWDDILSTQSAHGSAHHSLMPGGANFDVSQEDVSIMRQIRKDVPRTFSGVLMLQHPRAQLLLERVLFLWAIRHPASGYVQGMNDILLPFLFVVLAKKISSDGDVHRLIGLSEADVKAVSGALCEDDWAEVEADAYWLLSAFMSSVQSNFTFSQGGTHLLVQRLQLVVGCADPALKTFLQESGVSFEQFAFRWMNCFLLRELPPHLGVRLFDTYCAEDVDGGKGFGSFHVFVCAALLLRWSERLRQADDFACIVHLLQNPPTSAFTEETIGEVTAQAYVLHQQYGSRVEQMLKAQQQTR